MIQWMTHRICFAFKCTNRKIESGRCKDVNKKSFTIPSWQVVILVISPGQSYYGRDNCDAIEESSKTIIHITIWYYQQILLLLF